MGRKLGVLLFLSTLVLTTGSLHASIKLDATLGFGNYYRSGEWAPVTVRASTDGMPLSGQLVVEIVRPRWPAARYSRPMRVSREPAGYTLNVLMPWEPLDKVRARFVSGGRTLAETEIGPLERIPRDSALAVHIPYSPSNLSFLNGADLGLAHWRSGLGPAYGPGAAGAWDYYAASGAVSGG